MGTVVSSAMMSLDGYIARTDNTIGRLFDSLGNGEVEVPTASPDITFRMTPKTAAYWRSWMDSIGAIVVGRTLFDVTDGWGGRHTMDAPVVVVTHEVPSEWVQAHPGAPFTFATDGVAAAIAAACSTRSPSTSCPSSWGGAGPTSARWASPTSCSATPPPASRANGSPTWSSPCSAEGYSPGGPSSTVGR